MQIDTAACSLQVKFQVKIMESMSRSVTAAKNYMGGLFLIEKQSGYY